MTGRDPSRADTPFILIIEDNEDVREGIADLLQGEGMRTARASDGQQALELARTEGRPAAIVLDLKMPVMNGWEFLEAAQATPELQSVPVVVITGTPDESLARKLPVTMLRKPFRLNALVEAVRAAAGLKRGAG